MALLAASARTSRDACSASKPCQLGWGRQGLLQVGRQHGCGRPKGLCAIRHYAAMCASQPPRCAGQERLPSMIPSCSSGSLVHDQLHVPDLILPLHPTCLSRPARRPCRTAPSPG